jgi:hypothetical protein
MEKIDKKFMENILLASQEKLLNYLFLLIDISNDKYTKTHVVRDIVASLLEHTILYFEQKSIALEILDTNNVQAYLDRHNHVSVQLFELKKRMDNGEDVLLDLLQFYTNEILHPVSLENS